MNISYIGKNSDTVGIAASILCLLHCLVTPLLFMAHAGSTMLQDSNAIWWKSLDVIFLALSFMAIRRSVKASFIRFVKYGFWICWTLLLIIILNEKFALLPLPEVVIYPVSIALVALHVYNLKHYKCQEKCCKTDMT